jgi:hypothetical protein
MAANRDTKNVSPPHGGATANGALASGETPAWRPALSAGNRPEVLTTVEAQHLWALAIAELEPADFRSWVQDRGGFRCQKFELPALGVSWLDFSGTTKRSGLGLFTSGFAQPALAVYPAWDRHGHADCSLCFGLVNGEVSVSTGKTTHTFCPRCAFLHTGRAADIVSNFLFFSNHLPLARCNGRYSGDTQARSKGCVRIVDVTQTTPCHPEFFLHYNGTAAPCQVLKGDARVCVAHPGGPAVLKTRVRHFKWHMCHPCYVRLGRRGATPDGRRCPSCLGVSVMRGPVCDSCRRKVEAFVWRRTPAAIVGLVFDRE